MTVLHPRTESSTTVPTRPVVPVVAGDGVGPELLDAVRRVLDALGAPIELVTLERDPGTGLPDAAGLELVAGTGLLLKGPMATPIGSGRKSPNVTLRKLLDLHANIRPARLLPGVPGPLAAGAPDLVVVRENLEDVYGGVEHAQTTDVLQCLKLVSRSGSARVARTAFDLARTHGRSRVTCVTKSNIMKLTDGALLEAFRRESRSFPEIEAAEVLVDAAAAAMVTRPGDFDVVLTTNLYGDILSDLAAGLVGGLGLAPSANLGDHAAMFEPVHGTAPDIAGLDRVNPTAMLLSLVLLLRHVGAGDHAEALDVAIEETYRAGHVRTADVPLAGALEVGAAAFANAIAEQAARHAPPDGAPVSFSSPPRPVGARVPVSPPEPVSERRCVGADVFVEHRGTVEELASSLRTAVAGSWFRLDMISCRGVQVWPGPSDAGLVDHFRCRFVAARPEEFDPMGLLAMLGRITDVVRWTHVEQLHEFDGVAAYSMAYGARP